MGKSVRVAHKVGGAEIASYMITDGVATVGTYASDEMGVGFSTARYLFMSEENPAEGPDYAARVEKVGAKWRVHITVTYAAGGVFHNLYWTAGEFAGTRGTALYRAFLAFGRECAEGGTVRAQLAAETAERREIRRKLLHGDAREDSAPEPVGQLEFDTDAREDSGKIWGLTWDELRAMNAAHYAVHPVSPEVAALPDPHVKRFTWDGTDGAGDVSVVPCDYKGDVEIIDPEKINGKCPECRAYIPLQDVESDQDANRIGQHNRYGVANPPRPKILLSSESLGTVEHGSVPGSQADADKRRAAESRCKRSGKILAGAEGGTVPCPECARPVELVKKISQTKKGTKIKWQVPAHVDPRDTFRGHGSDAGYVKGERKVTPRGSGADAGKGQRDHGSIDGAANTGRQNMPPVRPGGWIGKAGTMSLPAMVRPGVDPEVSGTPCPICKELPQIAHKGMTKNQRRNHSRRVAAWHREENAKREAKRAADIEAGRILPAAVRRELRKAASIGSFAEGTQAATGEIAHGGTRPAVAPKLTPRGKTRAGK